MSETTHERATPGPSGSGESHLTPAELAARHGLTVSGARPPLTQYVRQLWGRRHFILAFSRAKLSAQYSQAKLGQLWQVFTPLLNAFVYFLIFGLLLGGRGGMEMTEYIPFLVIGVFVFTFTQQSVMSGVKAISGNLGLVRALHFPRASLPLSFSLQQLQQLLYSMIVVVVILVGFGYYPTWTWLLIVPVLLLQFVFNSGLAMIFARLGSHTPDLAQLMPFVLRTWMYGSGVMFPIGHMVTERAGGPQWVADVLLANPAAVYMELMRFALIDGPHHQSLGAQFWLLGVGWALLFGIGGFVYFWKAEERYGRG
ncbi:ABC transporter permease [Streptomyces calidiresistens]|uniref:Transport permease protein n=1 Tax=Streptomyces calidiresistens TaxID=1485586 RepID=A0A7W3XWB8_9ACTN|nr:ABC transporter permease [Streptomyces calidiresistens]MBB0229673.1 ABC transporter permease [Streptomyces calidiresistens]